MLSEREVQLPRHSTYAMCTSVQVQLKLISTSTTEKQSMSLISTSEIGVVHCSEDPGKRKSFLIQHDRPVAGQVKCGSPEIAS